MNSEIAVKDLTIINTSQVRKGVPEKATGQAKYTGDLSLPNTLSGAILHSPHAHARILSIDVSRAKRLTGVKCVITGKDVSRIKFGHSPARFDQNARSLDALREMVGQTDDLLQKVLEGLEALHADETVV